MSALGMGAGGGGLRRRCSKNKGEVIGNYASCLQRELDPKPSASRANDGQIEEAVLALGLLKIGIPTTIQVRSSNEILGQAEFKSMSDPAQATHIM